MTEVQGQTQVPTQGQIPVDAFRSGLLIVLDEVFEQVHGYLLDPGDDFFTTLATVSAAEASRPVFRGGGDASGPGQPHPLLPRRVDGERA